MNFCIWFLIGAACLAQCYGHFFKPHWHGHGFGGGHGRPRPPGRQCVGPCIGGLCSVGYACNAMTNWCCPSTAACPNGALNGGVCLNGQCNLGFSCNVGTNLCCPSCPNNVQPSGMCFPGGACGIGLTCINNMCCGTGTGGDTQTTVVPQATTLPPLPPPTCNDGSASEGPCFPDGTCGNGFVCTNTVCCAAPANLGRKVIG